jgi:TRAP-type C4-dicarboxylate transport system substrate-binding protein
MWLACSAMLLGQTAASAADKPIVFRLGTIAPRGSSYFQSLQEMGEKWREASGGKIKFLSYGDRQQGGEMDMVGLMQIGSLDMGLLTAVGLADIEPAVTALQDMPMSFHTLAEVDYVGEKLRPKLEEKLLAKGFQVLFWTDSGWVRWFSKSPLVRPDDLKQMKLFCWSGDVRPFDLWKSAGYTPVALETSAINKALMDNEITAVPVPPVFANFGRIDADAGGANHMLELNWAPLVGAAVVRKKSFDRVPAELQKKLLHISAETGKEVKINGRAENERAVAAMVKRGLIVQKVTPEIEAEWRAEMDKFNPKIRGTLVPADMFDEAQQLLREYRAAHPAQ